MFVTIMQTTFFRKPPNLVQMKKSPIRLIFDVDPKNLSPFVVAILDSNMAATIILVFFINAPPNIHLRA